tara:strand:+ start:576 stop:1133 length:558 start_codon:yes stop_codon:yes gene_type:complete
MSKVKRQRQKVGTAGSFQNQMMGNNTTEPKVNEGCTILHYSDRDAYEVIQVSEDKNSCIIRKMGTKHIGESYGDERYEYFSNPELHTMNLEWNDKKGQWGEVTYSVEIIKALYNKYDKQYGWGCIDILLKDFGLNDYQELYDNPEAEDNFYNEKKLIKGLTKRYKNFKKVSIIFGHASQYRDPSF